MNLTIPTKKLQAAHDLVKGIINRKSPLPILKHVLLESNPAAIRSYNADELAIRRRIEPESIEGDGATALPSTLFANLLKTCDDYLSIQANSEQSTSVVCGQSRWQVACMPSTEFPDHPVIENPIEVPLSTKSFLALSEHLLFATANSFDARAVMTGLRLECSDTGLVSSATDARRMIIAELPGDYGREWGVTIPYTAAYSMVRAARADCKGNVVLRLSQAQDAISFHSEKTDIYTKSIPGVFPDYRRVVPKYVRSTAVIRRQTMIQALQRTMLFSVNKNASDMILMCWANDRVVVHSDPNPIGTATHIVDCEYSGHPLTISFNARYFLDFLRRVKSNAIQIAFQDAARAACISEHNRSTPGSLRYVVMPMRPREIKED